MSTPDTTSQACNGLDPASSRPPSVFSAASMDTLVADKTYRGFASQDAYMTALREWADSKMYYEGSEQLRGFYGTKTLETYLTQPGSRSVERKDTDRRATVAKLQTLPDSESRATELPGEDTANQTKTSRLKRAFTRRKSVA